MTIDQIIDEANELHKAERVALTKLKLDPGTIDDYIATAGRSNAFILANWGHVTTQLALLGRDLRLAEVAFNGCHAVSRRQRELLERCKEVLTMVVDEYMPPNSDSRAVDGALVAACLLLTQMEKDES